MATLLCQAQLPAEMKWETRMGIIDQKKATELYPYVFGKESPLHNERMSVGLEFYINFKQLLDLAPYSDYWFYSGAPYENPTSIYRRMLDSIADPAIRMMLVEDVMEQANIYVDHLDSINVLRSVSKDGNGNTLAPLAMPMAKIKRAHYYQLLARDPRYYPSHLYDKEKAYRLYKEAFNEFVTAQGEMGEVLPGYYVQEYYSVCEDLYKSDEDKYYEQFLTDYLEIVQVCDKLLEPYYDIPDSIKGNRHDPKYRTYQDYLSSTIGYYPAKNDTIIYGRHYQEGDSIITGVKLLFIASGASNKDRLKAYYAPRLEANRQNKEYLDRAIQLMFENDLLSDSVVYAYCKASYELGATYNNCIGIANHFASSDKDAMRDYYMQALRLPSSDMQKATIHYLIATSLFTPRPRDPSISKPYSVDTEEYAKWSRSIGDCNTNLKLMLEYKDILLTSPKLIVRDYVAQAYYMMADNNYATAAAQYTLSTTRRLALDDIKTSIENFERLAQTQIKAETINGRKIAIAKKPAPHEVKKLIEERIRKDRNDKKAQADYDEYMRKKKAEEAFWSQGK